MAKIFIYTIMLVSLLAMVNLAGLPTASNTIINSTGFFNPSSWFSSLFVLAIITVIGGAAAAGILATYFGGSLSESYVSTLLFLGGGIFIAFIIDVGTLVTWINATYTGDLSWVGSIFTLMFGAIMVGYPIAMYQFWRGNDI